MEQILRIKIQKGASRTCAKQLFHLPHTGKSYRFDKAHCRTPPEAFFEYSMPQRKRQGANPMGQIHIRSKGKKNVAKHQHVDYNDKVQNKRKGGFTWKTAKRRFAIMN